MAVYKRGNVWWYKFFWNGEPIRASTKQSNKRTAEQIEATRKASLAKGEVGIKELSPAPTFREFSERFLRVGRKQKKPTPSNTITTWCASSCATSRWLWRSLRKSIGT